MTHKISDVRERERDRERQREGGREKRGEGEEEDKGAERHGREEGKRCVKEGKG